MREGDGVDQWRLVRLLGKGGSSEVWLVRDDKENEVALKIQNRTHFARRFPDEVRLHGKLGQHPGILPILASSFDTNSAESRTPGWIAMEVATPLTDYLGTVRQLSAVVDAVKSYSETLAYLAQHNVFHRDIKPSNLYWLNGRFVIGDFGIADFPDKSGLTVPGRKMGPANYLAPEMIEYSGGVASGPADVYSIAKTLWAAAAGRTYPPPGELRRDRPELRLSVQTGDPSADRLEPLLEQATAHDPIERPTMQMFVEELEWWGEIAVPEYLDLSDFATDVERLRLANEQPRPQTETERLERLYNEAASRVSRGILDPLVEAINSTGLSPHGSPDAPIQGWPPEDYGGSASLPRWSVATLQSPWLAACVRVVHRSHPAPDLSDLKALVIVATMNLDGTQNTHLDIMESFAPGSLQLDRIIRDIRDTVMSALPAIVAQFISACKEFGVPR